ncbi:replicase 1a [Shingleback nidovirus 1]|uniref:Replicase 1a n=1 Tax=Shingleback nidovirus 1 TaxID=1912590 RepID=A0A1I9RYV7_9NIDO|nr:replicase 1a [Shingleback nidovirus 1]AOZ57152.1 replicase 1a [Shingleback nidovirus 1]
MNQQVALRHVHSHKALEEMGFQPILEKYTVAEWDEVPRLKRLSLYQISELGTPECPTLGQTYRAIQQKYQKWSTLTHDEKIQLNATGHGFMDTIGKIQLQCLNAQLEFDEGAIEGILDAQLGVWMVIPPGHQRSSIKFGENTISGDTLVVQQPRATLATFEAIVKDLGDKLVGGRPWDVIEFNHELTTSYIADQIHSIVSRPYDSDIRNPYQWQDKNTKFDAVLEELNIPESQQLGEGVYGVVYQHENQVLKVQAFDCGNVEYENQQKGKGLPYAIQPLKKLNFEEHWTTVLYYYKFPGGNLFDQNHLTEDEKKIVLSQMLEYLVEATKRGFVHNDLHLNNVLWSKKKQTICIIDNGLSFDKEHVKYSKDVVATHNRFYLQNLVQWLYQPWLSSLYCYNAALHSSPEPARWVKYYEQYLSDEHKTLIEALSNGDWYCKEVQKVHVQDSIWTRAAQAAKGLVQQILPKQDAERQKIRQQEQKLLKEAKAEKAEAERIEAKKAEILKNEEQEREAEQKAAEEAKAREAAAESAKRQEELRKEEEIRKAEEVRKEQEAAKQLEEEKQKAARKLEEQLKREQELKEQQLQKEREAEATRQAEKARLEAEEKLAEEKRIEAEKQKQLEREAEETRRVQAEKLLKEQQEREAEQKAAEEAKAREAAAESAKRQEELRKEEEIRKAEEVRKEQEAAKQLEEEKQKAARKLEEQLKREQELKEQQLQKEREAEAARQAEKARLEAEEKLAEEKRIEAEKQKQLEREAEETRRVQAEKLLKEQQEREAEQKAAEEAKAREAAAEYAKRQEGIRKEEETGPETTTSDNQTPSGSGGQKKKTKKKKAKKATKPATTDAPTTTSSDSTDDTSDMQRTLVRFARQLVNVRRESPLLCESFEKFQNTIRSKMQQCNKKSQTKKKIYQRLSELTKLEFRSAYTEILYKYTQEYAVAYSQDVQNIWAILKEELRTKEFSTVIIEKIDQRLQSRSETSTEDEAKEVTDWEELYTPPKVDHKEETIKCLSQIKDSDLSLTRKNTKVQPGKNKCFVHAAAAVLAKTGQYFTAKTDELLTAVAAQQQQCAVELLGKVNIPLMPELYCAKHGRRAVAAGFCCAGATFPLKKLQANGIQFILVPAHFKIVSAHGNQQWKATAHLYYNGSGESGHWRASVTENGIHTMFDNGTSRVVEELPSANFTLVQIFRSHFGGIYQAPVTECEKNILVVMPPAQRLEYAQILDMTATTVHRNQKWRTNRGGTVVLGGHQDITSHILAHGQKAAIGIVDNEESLELLLQCAKVHHFDIYTDKTTHNALVDIDAETKFRKQKVERKKKDHFQMKKGKSNDQQAQMRAAIEKFFSNVQSKSITVPGIGIGKDLQQYAAIQHLEKVHGYDLHSEYLTECQKRHRQGNYGFQLTTTKLDMNDAKSDEVNQSNDLVVSVFAWHFKQKITSHASLEMHIVPVYNPQTYMEWSKLANSEVQVHSRTATSVNHTIKTPTMQTTETLHTTDHWLNIYGCKKVKVTLLPNILPELDHPHHKNFALIYHEKHLDSISEEEEEEEETTSGSGESGSDNGSQSQSQASDNSDDYETYTSDATESGSQGSTECSQEESNPNDTTENESSESGSEQSDPNQDTSDLRTPDNEEGRDTSSSNDKVDSDEVLIPCRYVSIHTNEPQHHQHLTKVVYKTTQADICRENCGKCLLNWTGDLTNQDVTNYRTWQQYSDQTLNEFNQEFIHKLHELEWRKVQPGDKVTDEDLHHTWCYVTVKVQYEKICFIGASQLKVLPNYVYHQLMRDFDLVVSTMNELNLSTAKKYVIIGEESSNEPVQQFLAYHSFAKAEWYSLDATKDHWFNVKTGEFHQQKQRKLIPEIIKKTFKLRFANHTIEISDKFTDKQIEFEQEYGLKDSLRFISQDEIFYPTLNDLNDSKPNYEGKTCSWETSEIEVVNKLTALSGESAFVTSNQGPVKLELVRDGNERRVYLNGRKQKYHELPVDDSFAAHAQACRLQYDHQVTDLKYYQPTKLIDNGTVAKIFGSVTPFILFPSVFTFFFSILLWFFMIFNFQGCRDFISQVQRKIETASVIVTHFLCTKLRIVHTSKMEKTIYWGLVMLASLLSFVTLRSLSTNNDIIVTTAPSYHTFVQKIMALVGIIPPLDEYRDAITLSEVCQGKTWLCQFGRPENKLYLNDYKNYQQKPIVFMTILQTILFYSVPWTWPFMFMNVAINWHYGIYNVLIYIVGTILYLRSHRCCEPQGPYCSKHATSRDKKCNFICGGRSYIIPHERVHFCAMHKWWCNTTHEHLLPHPIARSIEQQLFIRTNNIKGDSFYTFVNQSSDERLPEEFNKYDASKVYSVSHLSHIEWTSRCAILAYRSGQVVKVASRYQGSIKTTPVQMTKQVIDYFNIQGEWTSDYVAGQTASHKNTLHVNFLAALSPVQLNDFHDFCDQYNVNYDQTSITHDNFLNGKLPEELQYVPDLKGNNHVFLPYHQDTIVLDHFANHQHANLRKAANAHGYFCIVNKAMKKAMSQKAICIVLAILLLIATGRALFRKTQKIRIPAGLNPTGKDYAKGTIWVLEELPVGATPVALNQITPFQAWQFPNGTFAFTRARVVSIEKTECGTFSRGFYQQEKQLSCGKTLPTSLTFFGLSFYWLKAGIEYITVDGPYDSQSGAFCYGMNGQLVCHETLTFYTPASFGIIASSFTCLLILAIYLFLQLRCIFGAYLRDVTILLVCHTCTLVLYWLHPFYAIVFCGCLLFIPMSKCVLFLYVTSMYILLFGFNFILFAVVYVIVLICFYYFYLQRSSHIEYTANGLLFSGSFEGIATCSFILTPTNSAQLMSVTGLTMDQLVTMSKGPQSRPTVALANSIIKTQITGGNILYEPPVSTKLPAYLQRVYRRVNDFLMRDCYTNVCRIYDGAEFVGHGVFIDSSTVLTVRHVIGKELNVHYQGSEYVVERRQEEGFNVHLTIAGSVKYVPLQIDRHHELQQGRQYIHVIVSGEGVGVTQIHSLVPTPSGHFAFASTVAGESGSPVFYDDTLIGFHQGGVQGNQQTTTHSIVSRVDGTAFDPQFHDINLTSGQVVFDGNTIFATYMKDRPRKAVEIGTFQVQLNQINEQFSRNGRISPINDHELLDQWRNSDLSSFLSFVSNDFVVTSSTYQAYKVAKAVLQSKDQQKQKYKAYQLLDLSPICVIGMILSVWTYVGQVLRGEPFGMQQVIEIVFSCTVITTLFRFKQQLLFLCLGEFVINVVSHFFEVVILNLVAFTALVAGSVDKEPLDHTMLYQTIIRFGMFDAICLVIMAFCFIIKFYHLPRRMIYFTVIFYIYSLIVGGETVQLVSAYLVLSAMPSSCFAFVSYLCFGTQFYSAWFVMNFLLSLRVNYPTKIIQLYTMLTTDKVEVSWAFFSKHVYKYNKPPSYWQCLLSVLYYGQDDLTSFYPQSITMRTVIGQNVTTANVRAKSKTLMQNKEEMLVAQFVSAIEPILQSATKEETKALQDWLANVYDISQLSEWLENHQENDKETTKQRNIVKARIDFIKAKEVRLRKQLEAMQQEQVRGLIRCEQSLKLCQLLDRSIKTLQERASFRTKTFATGVIAASTIKMPEVLCITTPVGAEHLLWDDESNSPVIMLEDETVLVLEDLKDNEEQPIDSAQKIDVLKPSQFPLVAKFHELEKTTLQANIGYEVDVNQIEVTKTGEIRHTNGKVYFRKQDQVTNDSVLLCVDGVLTPFKAEQNISAPILGAIMTKLNQKQIELQSRQSITIGGLPNSVEHYAHSDQPLRTKGFQTFYGPSLCWFCQQKLSHDCKMKTFVQIPIERDIQDPTEYVKAHHVCKHNKFVCHQCNEKKPEPQLQVARGKREGLGRLRLAAKNW